MWIEWVDAVSERQRISWSECFKMSIIEFFNMINYIIYKNNKEKQQIEEWKRKH